MVEAMAVEAMPVVEVMVEEEMVAVGCATDDSTSDADDELAANKPSEVENLSRVAMRRTATRGTIVLLLAS